MNRSERSELMTDPYVAKIILGTVFSQGKKESYPLTVTALAYSYSSIGEKINITKTPEYATIRRRFKNLEEHKIIKKVTPKKKGEFKTYYTIEMENFIEFFLRYIWDLPQYGGLQYRRQEDVKHHNKRMKEYSKNKYVQTTISTFLSGMAYNYLRTSMALKGENEDWVHFIKSLTLREIVFLFFKKMLHNDLVNASEGVGFSVERKMVNWKTGKRKEDYDFRKIPVILIAGKPITRGEEEELEKKDPEKSEFLDFLWHLWQIDSTFLGHVYLNVNERDFGTFLCHVFHGEEDSWGCLSKYLDDPEKGFDYFPFD